MTGRFTSQTHRYEHQGLLGTVLDVRVAAGDPAAADLANGTVQGVVTRLELVFSAFDARSELCCWRRAEDAAMSPELCELMGLALQWQIRSGGRFNPLVDELSGLWRRAGAQDELPADSTLAAAAAAIQTPRFKMVDGAPVAIQDCSALNLNAIAKGYIVDRALDATAKTGVEWVCVNAGGDLSHRGAGSVRAGIENPHRPYDNSPPLTVIELTNRALATSGDARRGFRVAGRWFGHVLDPRTGWPVQDIASITVAAADAVTADVLATVAGVMAPAEAVEFLDGLEAVEGLVVDRSRRQRPTAGWAHLVVS